MVIYLDNNINIYFHIINIIMDINRYMNSRLIRDGTRIKSSHINLDYNKEKIYKINVIYQFFLPSKEERKKEIQTTLIKNVDNEYIDHIYLLNEREYSTDELGIKSSKINQIIIGKWLTFKDVFLFVENNNIDGYIITCNSDIFFDKTISNLHYTDLDCCQKLISLLRWEYRGEKNLDKCKIMGPRWDSQDTWIFHSKYNILKKYHNLFDFSFGQPGCDNKIIYFLLMLGTVLNNDPTMFKSYHYHADLTRNYSKQVIPSPYGYIIPEGVDFENKNYTHYEYNQLVKWTNNFNKWNFVDDNNLIKKLCNIHLSINKPILILDALNININNDNDTKYFEACSGYFICEPYSMVLSKYQSFYQTINDKIKQKQLLWYKLQNTLINSYNSINNWMNIYKDKRVLIITNNTEKHELMYKNNTDKYMNVFTNKKQYFINSNYIITNMTNENTCNNDNINKLINNVEKIKNDVDIVYIDVHNNVNNKIAYTIWKEMDMSCIVLSITY